MDTKIREIAAKHGINVDVFVKFMKLRFPNESDECYINEWAHRFSTGTPQIFMDNSSKQAYEKALNN